MKTIRTLVISPNAPDTNSVWLNKGTAKYFNNGEWTAIGNDSIEWDNVKDKPEFSKVATSGNYNDLSNKPTIPPPYNLPAATPDTIGGVCQLINIPQLIPGTQLDSVVSAINSILLSLKTAGIMVPD
jgi:hypothetical protein